MASPDVRDAITARYEARMSDLASQLADGRIDAADFQITMRQELRDAFALQLRAGNDGPITDMNDYLKLGTELKSQYSYLEQFSRDIRDGSQSPDGIANRVKMYARSSNVMYWKQYTKGVILPTYPGQQQCIGNCLCKWIPNGDGSWTWDRTNEKGNSCPDCIRNSQVYNPYIPEGVTA